MQLEQLNACTKYFVITQWLSKSLYENILCSESNQSLSKTGN